MEQHSSDIIIENKEKFIKRICSFRTLVWFLILRRLLEKSPSSLTGYGIEGRTPLLRFVEF